MLIKIIFLILFFLLIFEFILFPLIILLLDFLIKGKNYLKNNYEPDISVIVVTRNSSEYIKKRIENIKNSGYPNKKLEIILLIDKSTDETAKVVENIEEIKYFFSDKRLGKPALINKGVELSSKPIVVFTDDNVIFENQALNNLVKPFYYTDVFGATGSFTVKGKFFTEKIFQKLENMIKKLEGKFGLVIGGYGPIYAIRKQYFEKLPEDRLIMEDFINSINILKKGGKFVFVKHAKAYEEYNISNENDLLRKKRIGIGDSNALPFIWNLMKKRKNLLLYFFLFSHKLLRWFTAPILILLMLFNILIPYNGMDFYNIMFLIQFLIYLIAIILYLLKSKYGNFILGYFFLFWGFIVSKEEKRKPFWNI